MAARRHVVGQPETAKTGVPGVRYAESGGSTAYVLNQLHLPQTAFTSPTPAPSPATRVGRYAVSHAGIVYVFGHDATLIYTGGTTPRQYADDLTRLAPRTPA